MTSRIMPGTSVSGILCLLGIALFSTGCLGYRLGSTLPSDIRSVHVPPFVNATTEPQLENDITQATISEFQKDSSLTIETMDRADSLLSVTLSKYELEPLRYETNDQKRANEFRMKITAVVVFTRAKTGKQLAKSTVVGESTFVAGTDMPTDKKAALPKAAQDLARRIVQAVVEAW
ncbi:MAG: hypothetical protein C0404_05680 [Verrucomicrobia bacterium]|nr:hypothetical protein [Verrucomicrobiota bacterium]